MCVYYMCFPDLDSFCLVLFLPVKFESLRCVSLCVLTLFVFPFLLITWPTLSVFTCVLLTLVYFSLVLPFVCFYICIAMCFQCCCFYNFLIMFTTLLDLTPFFPFSWTFSLFLFINEAHFCLIFGHSWTEVIKKLVQEVALEPTV